MEKKRVLKVGGSFALPLTEFLRKIKANRKEPVFVKELPLKNHDMFCIIVSKTDTLSDVKLLLIDRKLWNEFYEICRKYHKNKKVSDVLTEIFVSFIDKYKKFWKRPIFRIET